MGEPARARPEKRKQRLRNRILCACVSFVVSLVVGVALLEWLLRTVWTGSLGEAVAAHGMFATDDSRTFYLRPRFRGDQTVNGRTTTILTNSDGRRDRMPRERGPRILVLGDSFVFGQGVAQRETISAQLAQAVTRTGSPVWVGNAGVPGHGTRDLAPSLQRQIALDPDLVIACTFLGNDFVEDCRQHCDVVGGFLLFGPMARAARVSPRVRRALHYRTAYLLEVVLARHLPSLAFDPLSLRRTPEEIEAFALFPKTAAERFGGLFVDRRKDDPLVAEVMERCRTNYRALLDVATTVPVLLVIIPTWWHLTPETWRGKMLEIGLDPERHEFGASQRRLIAVARKIGMSVADLTPELRAAPDRDSLYIPGDGHFSAEGCRRVAGWLTPQVERLLRR